MLSFRVFIMPKDTTVNVPDKHGCYATVGQWRAQCSLAFVHFAESTHRKKELLLAFADLGKLSVVATGIFVLSLQLPLKRSRNIFEETPRFTKISDVAGFSPVPANSMPWSLVVVATEAGFAATTDLPRPVGLHPSHDLYLDEQAARVTLARVS